MELRIELMTVGASCPSSYLLSEAYSASCRYHFVNDSGITTIATVVGWYMVMAPGYGQP